MSGGGRSARLESEAAVVEMDEFGLGGEMKKFDGLRQ
jgi:hypothetical protein